MFKLIASLTMLLITVPIWAEGDESLLLEVYVNGHTTGKIAEFTLRHVAEHRAESTAITAQGKNGLTPHIAEELLLRRSELAELGFRQPDLQKLLNRNDPAASDMVPLLDIQGLRMRIDAATQSLYITVPDERLVPTSLLADEGELQRGGSGRRAEPARL